MFANLFKKSHKKSRQNDLFTIYIVCPLHIDKFFRTLKYEIILMIFALKVEELLKNSVLFNMASE